MTRQSISIFVAGATDLRTERDALKSIANDLNGEFEHRGVKVIIRTYENFNESQAEYDAFIREKTDLTIFILDGRIGEKTRQEFILATNQQKSIGRPKVMVFLKEYKEDNPGIQYIRGLLETTPSEYAIEYKDLDNLRYKAEKKIRAFIESKIKEAEDIKSGAGEDTESEKAAGWPSKWLIFGLMLLSIIGLVFFIASSDNDDSEREPVLVIAGGGSALNHISRTHPDIDLHDYDGSIYLHLPSGNAWLLLTEEVISPAKNGNRRYYPVCVSAEAATDSSFLGSIVSIPSFNEHGSVIAFNLGNDTLVAYGKSSPQLHSIHSAKDAISTAELAKLLMNADKSGINIFSTSPNSGTRNTYTRAVKPYDANLDGVTMNYSEDSDLPTINRDRKPYLLLGSKNYVVKRLAESIQSGETVALTVCNDTENGMSPITKPVYLYCLAYTTENNELEFPLPTARLLEDLGIDTSGRVKNRRLQRPYNDRVIIPFEDVKKYVD